MFFDVNTLIIFNDNYLSTFDLDTDSSIYSSGGNNELYDPVRDVFRPQEDVNPHGIGPSNHENQNVQNNTTHTEEFRNYLCDERRRGATELGHSNINFTVRPDSYTDRWSLIAKCIREGHPDFFRRTTSGTGQPGTTSISSLIGNLDNIRENYPRVVREYGR